MDADLEAMARNWARNQNDFETIDEACRELYKAADLIVRLQKRLSFHDGCSRWHAKDSALLREEFDCASILNLCRYPNCGCPEERLCMVKDPNCASLSLNRPHVKKTST